MENKHIEHINKYMVNYTEVNHNNIYYLFPHNALFTIDTESCFKNENKGIPLKIYDFVKEKNVLNKDFDTEVHVYAWAIANTENDYVVYGENLNQLFNLFDFLMRVEYENYGTITSSRKLNSFKSTLSKRFFCHNLGWDIEFFKYTLNEHQYNYYRSEVNELTKSKKKSKIKSKSFSIVENDNTVYSSTINYNPIEVSFVKKSKGELVEVKEEIFPSIEIIDSFKIMSTSLDNLSQIISIDEMFYKMKDKYDYDKHRPVGHKLTLLEKRYLYNDVYILKEFINQFYKPLGTTQTTASAISFESFLNIKYEGEKNKYECFEEHFPDLTMFDQLSQFIDDSYRGGWTQANRRHINKIVMLPNKGYSIDINSSYPSEVRNSRLPYGTPRMYDGYYKPNEDELCIYRIAFDGFKNRNETNLIGEIQVGSLSAKEFNLKGTEYVHTNFTDDGLIGSNYKNKDYRYELCYWNFELEDVLKNTAFYTESKYYDEVRDMLIKTGDIKENYHVIETVVFKSEIGYFEDAVDHFTKMKIEGKEEDNEVKTAFAKLVLNSFYGKLASTYIREERELIFNEKGMCEFTSDGLYWETNKKYYKAFSSCVTAHARCNLRGRLYEIGFENIIYFDTDSLYTTLHLEEIKKRCGNILHPTELGKWDIEKEYNLIKAIGSKKYMLNGTSYKKDKSKMKPYSLTCKCAGLPKEVREEQTFSTFYLGNTFYGKKSKCRVKGGYALIVGDYKLSDNGR